MSQNTRAPRRVVIVDDHAIFRAGLKSELGDQVEVLGEAHDVDSAVEVVRAAVPEVVLLDVHLPGGTGGGGAEVVKLCRDLLEQITFLAISVSDEATDVVSVIRAGGRGYVTKTISTAELLSAIDAVAEGDAVFSPRLAGFVLDAFGTSGMAEDVRDEEPRPALRPGGGGDAADCPRLYLSGDCQRSVHLDQDGGDPRLQSAAQTAALLTLRTHPVG